MLLMVEKGTQHTKANNKYMKDYDKNKESSCLNTSFIKQI